MIADAEGDVVGDTQVREQRVVLKHHADPAFLRGQGKIGTGDHFVGEGDVTCEHRFEAGNGAQSGGFATPRRAEQTTDVARVEVQIQRLHHGLCVITTRQIAKAQQYRLTHAGW